MNFTFPSELLFKYRMVKMSRIKWKSLIYVFHFLVILKNILCKWCSLYSPFYLICYSIMPSIGERRNFLILFYPSLSESFQFPLQLFLPKVYYSSYICPPKYYFFKNCLKFASLIKIHLIVSLNFPARSVFFNL